eukprot:g1797.t1
MNGESDDCGVEEALLPQQKNLHINASGRSPGRREVRFGIDDNQQCQTVDGVRYAPNIFMTAKYTVASFVPLCLFAQFRRVANVYFLFVGLLMVVGSYCPKVFRSPLEPFSTIGPLCIVLLISMLKEAAEDCTRHRADTEMNSRLTRVVRHGCVQRVRWRDITVGDIVEVHDREMLPADIAILATSESDGSCRVETSNIDGESNLKLRSAALTVQQYLERGSKGDCAAVVGEVHTRAPMPQLRRLACSCGTLTCEQPNASIYSFTGTLRLRTAVSNSSPIAGTSDTALPPEIVTGVSVTGVALHGSMLRSASWVWGLVVYTGHETKLMQKGRVRANKMSRLEKTVNKCIWAIFVAQCVLCVVSTLCVENWNANNEGHLWYLLASSTGGSSDALQSSYLPSYIAYFLQFFILYGNLIPISLYVTIEIVNVAQAHFINHDIAMYDVMTDTPAVARSTNKAPDLGDVSLVFADKTGTMTKNIMTLQQCTIAAACFDLRKNPLAAGSSATDASDHVTVASHAHRMKNAGQSTRVPSDVSAAEYQAPGVSTKDDGHLGHSEPHGRLCLLHALHGGSNNAPEIVGNANYDDMAQNCRRFFECMSICHTVAASAACSQESGKDDLTTLPASELVYEAESPDEAALVEESRDLGVCYCGRHNGREVVRWGLAGFAHKFKEYEILAVNAFTSSRKRMSLLLREQSAEGNASTYILFVKGADSHILPRCDAKSNNATHKKALILSLDDFASRGLRTLVLARRELSEAEAEMWLSDFNDASAATQSRGQKLAAVANAIENDLEILGATGVEDQLQDQVPQTIHDLRTAGIRLWMLTGDKEETAVNIGYSTALLTDTVHLLRMRATGGQQSLERQLDDAIQQLASDDTAVSLPHLAMVIDGDALLHILGSDCDASTKWSRFKGPATKAVSRLTQKWLQVAERCSTVIACRLVPQQKADIVRVVKLGLSPQPVTLAIGDGANDVAMIKAASVGIGISGREGQQAANASDYSISQFCFLKRLLFIHGYWDTVRMAKVVQYSFYKVNAIFRFCNTTVTPAVIITPVP